MTQNILQIGHHRHIIHEYPLCNEHPCYNWGIYHIHMISMVFGVGDTSAFTSQKVIWDRFGQLIPVYMNLVYSEIGLAATYSRAMEEMYEENVQWMELRIRITNVRNLKTTGNVAKRDTIHITIYFIISLLFHFIFISGNFECFKNNRR